MIEYPKWKYALLALAILLGGLFALPNIFPQDPAVQISGNRGSIVDEALKEKAQGVLETNKIAFKAIELTDKRLLVRLTDADIQLVAAEALRGEFGDDYTVALNLASTVPDWLSSTGAGPMTLGLDLQGGVHFLMQVDQKASVDKQVTRFVDDIRGLLREKSIRYRSVNQGGKGLIVQLRSENDRTEALSEIAKAIPQLALEEGAVSAENFALVASVKPEEVRAEMEKALAQNIATLRNRINELGVAEPIITRQGADRIVVQLPGVQDTAAAKKILGATATLEYRAVDESGNLLAAVTEGRVPADSRLYYRRQLGPDGKPQPVLLKKKVIVTGDQLADAASGFDQQNGSPMVSVTLNNVGGQRMLDFTMNNVGRPMAVVYIERTPEIKMVEGKEVRTTKVTEEVISVANIQGVFGKNFQTTGLDSTEEASELALLLRAGALAAPVDIVEERILGPSLGKDNIGKGVNSVIAAFALVLVIMLVIYRMFGVVAAVGLVLNVVLIIACLSLLGATLTMPGIAGIVLTLGTSVDANVLIFERIREELRAGNTPLASIRAGYDKAMLTILDANITLMLVGLALFAFGTGPIKGFAVTTIIGILTSLFTAVTVSRALVSLIYSRRGKVKSVSI